MIYAVGDRIPQIAPDAYVAPGATVVGEVTLGARASVWFGAVLRGDLERIVIGAGTNIQDNSVVHTDPGAPTLVGERVVVGHQVCLHGCHVGDDSLIGIGAIVMNHAHIGARSMVGAGALVTEGKSFPDGVLILGSPAKVVRDLTAEELANMTAGAQRYINNAILYSRSLKSM